MKKDQRNRISIIHKVSGMMALAIIFLFFLASVYAEINGNHELILNVKTIIIFTMPIMLILMPAAAITGKKLAGKSTAPTIKLKNNRVKFIAINGMILMVLAVLLYLRASNGQIDNTFLILQFTEFAFGLANMSLLLFMIRDGRILTGKIKNKKNGRQ